jgi:peroxiredoxin Q/BCP
LGVSFDSVEDNRAFSEKFSFDFPLLCDVDRSMGLAYGATHSGAGGGAKRIGVVIDERGLIQEWEGAVNAASYPSDVLARL